MIKQGGGGSSGGARYALAFPNRYEVGISNLGLHTVANMLTTLSGAACELMFANRERGPGRGGKSGLPDVVALSLSFEGDYPEAARLLMRLGVELKAGKRGEGQPLVLAGGMAPSLNPEPLAALADVIYMGEAEPSLALLHHFFSANLGLPRKRLLEMLAAAELPGVYVPSHPPGVRGVEVQKAAPGWEPAHSTTIEAGDAFGGAYLLEISRGCPHGCRFCAAGHLARPTRFIPAQRLQPFIEEGANLAGKLGLVGAAVSDHPEFPVLAEKILSLGASFSVSSFRVENMTPENLELLKRGGLRTLTVALEAGSEPLRKRVGKNLSDDQLLRAASLAAEGGLKGLRIYAMIGLPGETVEDVENLAKLAVRAKKALGRGTLSLSVAPFVPKPHTPFQWEGMAEEKALTVRMRILKSRAAPHGVDVVGESPKWARVQGLFSRGGRWVGDLLAEGLPQEEWAKLAKSERGAEELGGRKVGEALPWDFVRGGPSREYLAAEAESRGPPCECPSPGCDCAACMR